MAVVMGGDDESTSCDSGLFTSPSPSFSGVYDQERDKDINSYVNEIVSQDNEWIDLHRHFIMENPLLLPESPLKSKVSVLKLKFTKSSQDFCKAFQVSAPCVFDGGEYIMVHFNAMLSLQQYIINRTNVNKFCARESSG